jgi:invasion protein IalB
MTSFKVIASLSAALLFSSMMTPLAVAAPAAPSVPEKAAEKTTSAPEKAPAKTAEKEKPADNKPQMITKAYEDWQMECTAADKAHASSCFVFQRIIMKDRKLVALTAAVIITKQQQQEKASAVLRFVAPFGVSLPPGLAFVVDSNPQIDLKYQVCVQKGCMADLPLDDAIVAKIKNGKTARVAYQAPDQAEPYVIGLSLKGFTAAYDALQAMTP